jgi:hypothetical protein
MFLRLRPGCHACNCAEDCSVPQCQAGCDRFICDERLADFPFRGTWRSAESVAYGFPFNRAHQTETLTRQLNDGVRMLHFKVDYCNPGATSGPLCICPGDNLCASGGSTPLLARLQELNTWMEARTDQVVIVIFDEPAVAANDLRAVIVQAGLDMFFYANEVPAGHRFQERLVDHIRYNRRLLVFAPGFLDPDFLFITDSRRRLPTDPEPGQPGYADFYPGLHQPFSADTEPPRDDEECERQGQVPGNPAFFIARHVLPASANGPLTSFDGAGCYLRRLTWHLGTCALHYPQLGPVRHALVQFYNAGEGALVPIRARRTSPTQTSLTELNCRDVARFSVATCLRPFPFCFTSDDCPNNAECSPFFNCVNCASDARKPFGRLYAQNLGCASNLCDITCVDCTAAPQRGCNFSTRFCLAGRCNNKAALGATCGANNQCTCGNCHFGVCRTSCSNDNDCPSNQWCDAFACVPQVPRGTPCIRNRVCQSGVCSFLFCT